MSYTAAEVRDLRVLYHLLPKQRLIDSFEQTWKAITSKANALGARRRKPGTTQSPLRREPEADGKRSIPDAQLSWWRFAHEYYAMREQQMKENK
jgi:hypothetical protein